MLKDLENSDMKLKQKQDCETEKSQGFEQDFILCSFQYEKE